MIFFLIYVSAAASDLNPIYNNKDIDRLVRGSWLNLLQLYPVCAAAAGEKQQEVKRKINRRKMLLLD